MSRRALLITAFVFVAIAGGVYTLTRSFNAYQMDGELRLSGLTAPVRVLRDEYGIPYIFASNTPDLIRAQGFVTAQHRLFQLEAYRAIAYGRLAEVVGESGLRSDREMRLLGIARNAKRHAALLDPAARDFIAWFVEGINAYITEHADEHPVELKLSGFRTAPWSVEDVVALLHYVNFSQAVNYRTELLTYEIIQKLGYKKGSELFPLSVNPDRKIPARTYAPTNQKSPAALSLNATSMDQESLSAGSNNWAVCPQRSASGAATVANDPHLDVRRLPGIWHPVGLFSPDIQAVGAALPGIPGLIVGRTAQVAFGVTNSYGDSQDLYIETIDPTDPNRYLDGGVSRPLEISEELIKVKDATAPGGVREEKLQVRRTRRGPVVSESPASRTALSLRTAAAELPPGGLGIERMLHARDAREFDLAVQGMGIMYFNYVYADRGGAIGHRTTGRIPIRASGHGGFPKMVGKIDDWRGYVPADQMPGQQAPSRCWIATANNDTRPDAYPYYYSNYSAPPYRYESIKQRLENASTLSVADHLALMHNVDNKQARRFVAKIVDALNKAKRHPDLAAILAAWDFNERTDSPAPTIYHAIYERVARLTFADELGEDLAQRWLASWYIWQSRFDALIENPTSPWFDDKSTAAVETLPDLILRATDEARADLEAKLGKSPAGWTWGKVHTITFVSPLREKGIGRDWLGSGTRPFPGSLETVHMGRTTFGKDSAATFFPSMRFIADMADNEKVMAVLAGGVSERHLQPHRRDQLDVWFDGELAPWWFDRAAVEAHAQHRVTLRP